MATKQDNESQPPLPEVGPTAAKRIRLGREAQGISQAELACLTGLDKTLISAIENNRRPVRLMTAIRLSGPLKTNWWSLLSNPEEEGAWREAFFPGRKLAILRDQRVWTLLDVASRSGLSAQHISSMESGRKRIGPKSALALALAFEMTPQAFATAVSSPNRFPYTLRKCRAARGWSQTQLAVRSGIDLYILSRLECGSQFPTTEQEDLLWTALGNLSDS